MPRCKSCKTKFEPKFFLQKFCLGTEQCKVDATMFGIAEVKKKSERDWQKEKKVLKEKLKTHKDYLKELQIVFNTYIRLRDINKGCISCGRSLVGVKFDAGHFYSVGGNPALRFNENNVHGQCVHCNRDKHGNLLEYAERLPERIGQIRFDVLKMERNNVLNQVFRN